MALSSNIKDVLNKFVHPLGIQLITTRKQRVDTQRLLEAKQRGHWLQPRYQSGMLIDEERISSLLKTALQYKNEYEKLPLYADEIDTAQEFYLKNGWFEFVDAEMLYSIIREYKPRTVIEVGNGNSTRLMWRGIQNGNLNTRIISIDPSPRIPIMHHGHEHIAARIETIPASNITDKLVEGDILFIDSGYEIVTAGDIPFLFLEVLPNLQPGVLVHVHDIFFPFDYPEEFVLNRHWTWTERYLVHAFLCHNSSYDILWPARYMWENHKQTLLESFSRADNLHMLPSSLWLRKIV